VSLSIFSLCETLSAAVTSLDGRADVGVNIAGEHILRHLEWRALDDDVAHAAHKVGVGVDAEAAGPRMAAQEQRVVRVRRAHPRNTCDKGIFSRDAILFSLFAIS
jgi:hypothetical protein